MQRCKKCQKCNRVFDEPWERIYFSITEIKCNRVIDEPWEKIYFSITEIKCVSCHNLSKNVNCLSASTKIVGQKNK